MSGQNGKVAGMVAENPAPGEKGAIPEDDDELVKQLMDAEILATDCISEAFPEAETELSIDDWAYDVYINKELIGAVYFIDSYDNRFMSAEEICAQVQDIKKYVAQKGD